MHISQMSRKYIKHPLEAVSVGDIVEVKVLGVDMAKKRDFLIYDIGRGINFKLSIRRNV